MATRLSMSRGVLILDGDLLSLQTALEAKNFRVYLLKRGLSDDQKRALLAHRILITDDVEAFRLQAAESECSLIDTSGTDHVPAPIL